MALSVARASMFRYSKRPAVRMISVMGVVLGVQTHAGVDQPADRHDRPVGYPQPQDSALRGVIDRSSATSPAEAARSLGDTEDDENRRTGIVRCPAFSDQ